MSEPTTPLPGRKASADDERSVLTGYLDYFRAVLARKAEGITEAQARIAACPPSDLTLIGLVRHMADVERNWFRRSLMAEDAPPIFYGAAHPDGDEDGDLHPPPDATMAVAFDTYWAEIAVANRNIAAHSMDDLTRGNPQPGQHPAPHDRAHDRGIRPPLRPRRPAAPSDRRRDRRLTPSA